MTGTWEGAYCFHEGSHIAHELVHCGVAMVAGDGVMQLLPQLLDVVDPRRVGGLENQLELRMARQPAVGNTAVVNHEVVHDEQDSPRTPVTAVELVQQMDEQAGILALVL